MLVAHMQHADRPHLHPAAGEGGLFHNDHDVERIAVTAPRPHEEAIVGRVMHRRIQHPV
jgi:hypothetical protein